jgi:deoxyribodipyrimidine photo-lyase
VLVWFRNDLRVADNPALADAARSGRPVVALFVLDRISEDIRGFGAASRWWLKGALDQLSSSLSDLGISLTLRHGPSADVVRDVARDSGAGRVVWNRRDGAPEAAIDRRLEGDLVRAGMEVEHFQANLLFEPGEVKTRGGEPFRVFTPFWRAAIASGVPRAPLAAPAGLKPGPTLASDSLADWRLEPGLPNWAKGMDAFWRRGERGAEERLARFVEARIDAYRRGRDYPADAGTSELSPHLAFGEVSPFQLWHAATQGGVAEEVAAFRRELGWREFNHHIAHHFPGLHERSFQPRFDHFPWRNNAGHLEAWQRGRTGYPIVDAGMRQLWELGWMHNRVRMIVASFLIKDLLIDWREGEVWFWDTLVDADAANNAANWQWVAGSGADAAPFFRVFNPSLQGEKFDPDGTYVRRFVPELAKMPGKHIHRPWEADDEVLAKAGVRLGETYPRPIVNHGKARDLALAALRSLREPD